VGRQYNFFDGELRIYEGSASNCYFKVVFVQADPQIPMGRPRPEQRLIMDRGRFSADAKFSKGGDETRFAPLDMSFSARIDESTNRDALFEALTVGTVGGKNFVTTKATTQTDGITLPPFDNDAKMRTVNIELLYTGNTNNFGYKCNEVFFPPEMLLTGPADTEGINMAITGRIWGDIVTISSFTAGVSKGQ
jgi:hypothetical protein